MSIATIRIPYTTPFPPALIYPPTATSLPTAIAALKDFLIAPYAYSSSEKSKTLLLTGAGVSVESGLADYRGENGTYRLNQKYKPTFYGEFISNHEARKRYWARSFLGWPTMEKAKPNKSHIAISRLGKLGFIHGIITQNVDSLHHVAYTHSSTRDLHEEDPSIPKLSLRNYIYDLPPENSLFKNLSPPIIEIHGTLRHITCLTCSSLYPRAQFQQSLEALNPAWAEFLQRALGEGVFDPAATREERIRTNPDGDVDLPGVPYTKFRYPPCPKCLSEGGVEVDREGAHLPNSATTGDLKQKNAKGILKPSVVFFGEGVQEDARSAADQLIEASERILVIGSSLATYSAWKIVKEMAKRGKGVGVINIGGVRGEAEFFKENQGQRLRIEFPAADVLGGVVEDFER